MLGLIISLVSGAVGGNVAGAVLKNLNLGMVGNSIAGILGGAGLSQLLPLVGMSIGDPTAGGGLDIGTIISSLVSGGVGGAGAMALVGAIRKAMA
ncbi:MAG: hypothetical protein AAFR17_11255 [Pseudomonadota bacterium]